MGSAHNQNANHSANKNISVPFAFRSSFQFSLPAAGCKLPAAAAVAVASCLLQAAPTGGRYSNYFQATLITHKSLAGSGQPIDTPAAPAASMGQSEREREGKRWHRERERWNGGEQEGSLFCQRHFPANGLPLQAGAAVAVAVVAVVAAVVVASGHKMLFCSCSK